jgi:uncharacterized protein (DUF305 family)
MKLNCVIALLIIVVFVVLFFMSREEFKMPHNHKNHEIDTSKKNPCYDYLTDMEYLEHMIPHHVVAIDMSKELIKTSRNPIMLALARNIIRHQSYEVWEMRRMMANLETDNMYSSENLFDSKQKGIKSKFNYYEPNKSRHTGDSCDPLFFDPDAHMKHMSHMPVTDIAFLQHMIPHHQVAVDMSQRLLLHSKNSYTRQLCQDIILEQEAEILLMNQMLEYTDRWNYSSDLV